MSNPMKLKAEVAGIESYGEGVYKVDFLPQGRVPRFKPGQFLHLAIDEFDPSGGFWPESRVFSIASRYGAERLSILYSVKGSFTRRMQGYLGLGKTVWLKFPYGDFIIGSSTEANQDVVLVAGGTGISPFIPFLYVVAESEGMNGRKLALYYGVRRCSLLMFPEVLARCAARENFALHLNVEAESPQGIEIAGARFGEGRLDIHSIRQEAEALHDPVFFLSGPPAMIRAFRQELSAGGVPASHIKIDEWE